ncbi:molecular chaperone GrpE [Micrococcales bacterium KH10]|nr:molecular chaperone GrpE [Micrococcales bacterium KH10]
MTDSTQHDPEESADAPFHFADNRRIDPETGEVRDSAGSATPADPAGAGESSEATAGPGSDNSEGRGQSGSSDGDSIAHLDFEPSEVTDDELSAAKAEAAQLLDDLQRERASFTNYRNRALRDQEAARVRGIEEVLTALLPVLDDISRAQEHEELEGPFAAIVEKLTASLTKTGIEPFGVVGEEFDPTIHEALMHQSDDSAEAVTVTHVIEPGYRIGDKIVRAARVAVTGPQQ